MALWEAPWINTTLIRTSGGRGNFAENVPVAEVRILKGIVKVLDDVEKISTGQGAEKAVTSYVEEVGYWTLMGKIQPVQTDATDVKLFKKVLLGDIKQRREEEKKNGSNKNWLSVLCAAVLFHPSFKKFKFGGEVVTESLSVATAKI